MKYNLYNPDVAGINVIILNDPLYADVNVHVKAKETKEVELTPSQAKYLDSAYARLEVRTAPSKEQIEAIVYVPSEADKKKAGRPEDAKKRTEAESKRLKERTDKVGSREKIRKS